MKTNVHLCLVVLLLAVGHVMAADELEYHEASYVLGYVSAVIEHAFNWDTESYDIAVNDDVVMLTLIQQPGESSDALAQRKQIATRELPLVVGVSTVDTRIVTLDITAPTTGKIQADDSSALSLSRDGVPFPTGNLFRPLMADPKEPRFFASLRQYETSFGNTTVGAVGFGEHIAFYKWPGRESGDGLQIGLSAAVFAQFDMDARSSDLINADYVVGFPLSYRRGDNSVRLRLYHQSSHLGDEFLINRRPERINLSYESLELLYAYTFKQWRPYIGGEYLVHRDPEDLKPV